MAPVYGEPGILVPVGQIKPAMPINKDQLVRLTVSTFGDLYLIDSRRHEILHLDAAGRIINRQGGYGWGDGQLNQPTDICIQSNINILVADYHNFRLLRYDRSLHFITGLEYQKIGIYPLRVRSLAISAVGELYLLDDDNQEIIRYTAFDQKVNRIGGYDYGRFALTNPAVIRFDETGGRLVVLEQPLGLVFFDRYGTPLRILKPPTEEVGLDLFCAGSQLAVVTGSATIWLYNYQANQWTNAVSSQPVEQWISGAWAANRFYLLDRQGLITVSVLSLPEE